jgi:hypothetical protein
MLDALDAPSVALVVHGREKLKGQVPLVEEEALLAEARGDVRRAARRRAHARALAAQVGEG